MLAVSVLIPFVVLFSNTEIAETATMRYVAGESGADGGVYRVGFLAFTAAMFLWLLKDRWKQQFPRDHRIAHAGSIVIIILLLLLPISSVIADRLGYYMVLIQAMIFARISVFDFRYRNSYILIPAVLSAMVLTVWMSLSWHFDLCYLPYQTWLFGFPDDSTFNFEGI